MSVPICGRIPKDSMISPTENELKIEQRTFINSAANNNTIRVECGYTNSLFSRGITTNSNGLLIAHQITANSFISIFICLPFVSFTALALSVAMPPQIFVYSIDSHENIHISVYSMADMIYK